MCGTIKIKFRLRINYIIYSINIIMSHLYPYTDIIIYNRKKTKKYKISIKIFVLNLTQI